MKGPDSEPLEWNQGLHKDFEALKQALTEAPALGLPNSEKRFTFFIYISVTIALSIYLSI